MSKLLRETKNGEVWDMSLEEYLAHEALGSSDFKGMHRSMAHWKAEQDEPKERSAQAQELMDLGSVYHYAVMQPELLKKQVSVLPEGFDARRKADREERDRLKEEYEIVIKPDLYQDAMNMADETHNHPWVQHFDLFKAGQRELSYFTKILDVPVKIRPDWIPDGIEMMVDLKSTDDARSEGFSKKVANLKYYLSGALYLNVKNKVDETHWLEYWFLVCERDKPYGIKVYGLDPESLTLGETTYVRAIEHYKDCMAKGIYPCYDPNPERIGVPQWHLKKEGYYD
jgi:hypothetical protein